MTRVSTEKKRIDEILIRGTEDIFVHKSIREKLQSGRRLTVKFGIDPTSPNIHLGRAVPLKKLRALQDLGHRAVLVIGDFTARIGDPSDKLQKRPILTKKEVRQNMKQYEKLLAKIIDVGKTKFVYNSTWFEKMTASTLIELAEMITVGQVLARRNFKERMERGAEVSVREFLYPLLQGYDSVKIKSDIEIGGLDQLFNLKVARAIQEAHGMPPQDILTTQMLEGTDGRKMSGSWGNVINVDEDPADTFGKVMSVRDDLIGKYFLLATNVSEEEIAEHEHAIDRGERNPRDVKLILAREIVGQYHGKGKAEKAEQQFLDQFSRKIIPDDIKKITVPPKALLRDIAVEEGMAASKSEFARKVREGAVRLIEKNGKEMRVGSVHESVQRACVLKIGRKILALETRR